VRRGRGDQRVTPERAQVDAGISTKEDATPQATIRRLSASVPISAIAASIEAIERCPPKNDEFARRSTLALSTGSWDRAWPILRASTLGSRKAASRLCTICGMSAARPCRQRRR
jgi:hypothetical protein